MEFTIQTHEGDYDLSASVRRIGDDILVAIWGGEKPPIGAVAAAQPRASLKDPNVTSSTASVLCYVGHKDDELATLAATFDTKAVVTAERMPPRFILHCEGGQIPLEDVV